jgi:paraquat-inducible protein B
MTDTDRTVPTSRIEAAPRHWGAWLLPIVALLFTLYLGYEAWGGQGPSITIVASEGHGLGLGDPLRYRGITVGEVRRIELTEDLAQVALIVRLEPGADGLCREDSRFWVVRPHMALDGVQGLETIVGARYLSVMPGPLDSPPCYRFTALGDPPVPEPIEPEGLELVFEASSRLNLVPGAQITYRDVPIGTVLGFELASDATHVDVHAYVRPDYVELVRENSWFWNTGGLEVNLALTEGLTIEMDSLRSLVIGGIALATPTEAGPLVEDGRRFYLHEQPHEDADSWHPSLAIGDADIPLPAAAPRPPLVRATLRWREGKVFKSKERLDAWLLPVTGGLMGPADLLVVPEDAIDGSAVLELLGRDYPLETVPEWVKRGVAFLPIAVPGIEIMPRSAFASEAEAQDCLAYASAEAPPLAISTARFTAEAKGWRIDSDLLIEESWHGAAVFGRDDGCWIGVLLISEEESRVAVFP